jgi:hypothetical protein
MHQARPSYAFTTLFLATALAACGSSSGEGEAGADATVRGGSGGGPSDPASEDPTAPPELDCRGFELELPPWEVAPGENTDYCMRLPMPDEWLGRDLSLTGWSYNAGITHHLFVEYSPNPFEDFAPAGSREPVGCGTGTDPRREFDFITSANGENSRIAFGGGNGTGSVMLEPGVGKFLPASGHFRTSHHVINTATQPVETYARFNLCVQDAEDTAYLANSLVCTTLAIDVPAGTVGEATGTCTAPFDMNVVLEAHHAHNHMVGFELRKYDGASAQTLDDVIYEGATWDDPELASIKIPLRAGDGLTFTCIYEGEARFSTGASEEWAEHCAIFSAYTYMDGQGMEYQVPPPMLGISTTAGEVVGMVESIPGSPI